MEQAMPEVGRHVSDEQRGRDLESEAPAARPHADSEVARERAADRRDGGHADHEDRLVQGAGDDHVEEIGPATPYRASPTPIEGYPLLARDQQTRRRDVHPERDPDRKSTRLNSS